MRDGFDRISGGCRGSGKLWAMVPATSPLPTTSAPWSRSSGVPTEVNLRRIPVEECERRRSEGDPECTNPRTSWTGGTSAWVATGRSGCFGWSPPRTGTPPHPV
jgi:hypothetical protein